jgi:hypothetical protein
MFHQMCLVVMFTVPATDNQLILSKYFNPFQKMGPVGPKLNVSEFQQSSIRMQSQSSVYLKYILW